MTRRALALIVTLAVLLGMVLLSALPVRAARPHTVDPASIDPVSLKLPDASLPPGSQVVHSDVSTNDDAQGTTTPADGDPSVFGLAHGGPTSYNSEGRITGYRMDIHYDVNGTAVRTGYLASIYPSADKAQAAYNDVTGQFALIHIIGGKALPDACTVGEKCDAEYFISPLDTSREAVSAVFIRGAIVVETASDAPAAQFSSIESAWEALIYSLLQTADRQVQNAESGTPPSGTPTNTPTLAPATATATTAPPTSTATPTATTQPLFVHVKVGHSAVKRGKKQSISVSTLPVARVGITVKFPRGSKKHHSGNAGNDGKFSWHFTQPTGSINGKNRTAHVSVTVNLNGEKQKASKKYSIR